MAVREKNNQLQELFDKGIPVYSYSKLSSWEGCKYNWYNTYILHKKSKDNIYSSIGEVTHDSLQALYDSNEQLTTAKEKFNSKIRELESNGIKFPEKPPTTKLNYINNMNHFFDNYNKLDTKMITEQFVLLKIPRFNDAIEDKDFIWMQMYIDSIIPVYENGEFTSVIVNDWKTSSKFDKEKLIKAGKQLLVYKLGVEQSTGVNVSKIGWTMLKYVYCCYRTKGSKNKPSEIKKVMQERKDSVKYFYKKIINDLISKGMDTMEAEILAGKAVNKNSFSILPKDIQEKYWIEDCFLEYEFTNETIKGCKEWIIKIVNEIENAGDDINNYPAVTIDKKSSYFCYNLCGRPDCTYLKKYKSENISNFKKEKKSEEISDKIGIINKKINLDVLFK